MNTEVQVGDGSGPEAPISGLIYDVGAHEGQDTEFYLKKGFRVVAIECNPTLVTQLSQRFAKEAGEGRFVLVPFAISDSVGEIDFYVNVGQSIWSTADPKFAQRNEKLGAPSTKVRVPARPFQSILSEFGVPYYLKVDIEGSDIMCLEALRGFAARPRYVSIESEQRSWRSLLKEFDLLEELGYSKFQLVSQSMVPEQRPPREAREGIYADHVFPHGSTGLFGRELPEAWVSREEAVRRYWRIFIKYRLFGHNSAGEALLRHVGPYLGQFQYRLRPGWWDTHATR